MFDPKASLTVTLAWIGWVLGGVFVVVDLLTAGDDVGHVGIFFVGAAAVLHIRSFFCVAHQEMRNAFELGVDTGRSQSTSEVPVQRIR